ncbi:substrate-binding periplasmic protein [Insolitispirillum peregrinum]|uniref:ABC-type amino acid transport substrate-binding protein n=1 Tax=Insolitispirillum peregrinum TaxID=80876 RepID=A0A1N7JB36_9PROT|nr:ABC transporter substrate-binding protein [Insolitispirillum peregrinum]SIS46467.1 ABC-type amino acid transport substrate-binding protein [Insolitispirillum peregrinum]
MRLPLLRSVGLLAVVLAASVGIDSAGARAASHLDSIQKSGRLRVCIWPAYFGITYRNPRNGQLEGIDIDLAHQLASDLKVSAEFVDSSFADLVKNLTTDACDIAMHAVGVRPDRAEHMDFSAPYLVSGIYAVAPRTHASIRTWADIDQPGHVVVVQKGTYMEPVMRETLKKAQVAVVEDFKQREQEVESGRADVFMTDYPYGQRMATQTPWATLLAPPTPLAPTPYAYAVPKGDSVWLARVNQFVSDIKRDGRLTTYAEKNGLAPIIAP